MTQTDRPLVLRPSFPLVTERLALRPFNRNDLDRLYAMQSRADVTRYLYWGPRSRDFCRDLLGRVTKMVAIDEKRTSLRLAVTRREDGRVIGDVGLELVSRTHSQGELGFVFHPDYHGRGYATEAGAVMLGLGFERLGLHRIVGRCDARNLASARLLHRLGMRREAHLVENEFVKGEWTDELVYALLASERQLHR